MGAHDDDEADVWKGVSSVPVLRVVLCWTKG